MELISSPSPHFIPGYTGFCPQLKYRIGDTYGNTTHKALLDPAVCHAEKLILNKSSVDDDSESFRPSEEDIERVKNRHGDTIYQHPMVPGYDGIVPREHAKFGQRYSVQATEALADFANLQLKKLNAHNQMTKIGYLQDNRWDPKTLEDKELTQSQFRLPLTLVRAECGGLVRGSPGGSEEQSPIQPGQSESPYFSDNVDPEKYLKAGFTGHVPFSYQVFGKTNEAMTNTALCDFTNSYRKRLSNEWAPVEIDRVDHLTDEAPMEIYLRDMGQIPKYGGHIPGGIFRYGKTYGNDTRDAKRWLRGDFSQ